MTEAALLDMVLNRQTQRMGGGHVMRTWHNGTELQLIFHRGVKPGRCVQFPLGRWTRREPKAITR